GFERAEALITVQELKQLIDAKDPKLVLIAVAKPVSYRAGYIPGAVNVWRPDYEPKEGEPFPFGGMMLGRKDFEEFARRLGVDNDSKVVLYDEKYDATRLWWGFYMYGKTDVRVLDGGYQAWKKAGYPVKRVLATSPAKKGNFTAKGPLGGWSWGMDMVWRAKNDPDIQLWDTREKDEWDGSKLKSGAFRKGRVPWAKFLNWKEFKKPVAEGEAPTEFRTAAEIAKVIARHGMDPNKHQLFYCQSGVRTTTEMFALYLMGWDPAKLHNHDGSWIEWSYYKENPVVCEKCE
ncbi:MAG: sulfurtransferase, partial [Bacteroidetes bacterium]